MQERVVVTGMGTVNPIGLSVEQTWENALNCVSGVGPITLFDASDLLVQIACEVKSFNPHDFMSPREARRRDRFEQFAAAAAKEAISQAGLNGNMVPPHRVGVLISSAIGGIETTQEGIIIMHEKGPRRISPLSIPMLMVNGASGMVAIDFGFEGPCFSISSACASGCDAIGTALTLIRSGIIDAAVVGASEATICRIGVATFDRVGAMSRRNQDYSMTPQPFDYHRDGLVMGEGAAVLVLERENLARQRGADILAELAGYGSTADAYHVTAPSENGTGGASAIRGALESSRLNPEDVDYINAHGTATKLNDASETKAIQTALGKNYKKIPVSSTKSMTGHMMGATGALETILCVLMIQKNILLPTIHYHTPDPDCELYIVPNQPREKQVKITLNNAFGFGGHNAVLAIRQFP
jgi:beta-ketoacyl-acyl-carrier-protein synthase II